MQRKVRVPNPDYTARVVDWKLHMSEPSGFRDGILEISFRKPDSKNHKSVLSLKCFVSEQFCQSRKIGIMKTYDRDGQLVSERAFSTIDANQEKPIDEHNNILNSIIELVAKNCVEGLKSAVKFLEGTTLIPPSLMKIPKIITVQEISYEELREAGQL